MNVNKEVADTAIEAVVTTSDEYILSLQRFLEGKTGGGGSNKQPVLLQHGVLVDGMTWLLNPANQSLALILADNGYDDFWDWTWDALVAHDLPATIDFVFEQTGQKVHYVGHSLGTLIALTSFSEGKQVDKVKSAALLSPIAYLNHMTTAFGVLATRAFVGEITTIAGFAEFNPKGEPVANFLKVLCLDPQVDCFDLITALALIVLTRIYDGFQMMCYYEKEVIGQISAPNYAQENVMCCHQHLKQRAHSSSSTPPGDVIAFSVYADLRLEYDVLQQKYDKLMERLEEVFKSEQQMGEGPKAKTISRLETLTQMATTRLQEMPVQRDQTSQIVIQMMADELKSVVRMLREDNTPDVERAQQDEDSLWEEFMENLSNA
ncbi:hypothetical protein POM88_016414 [Heracleum sosnowskyi]|uniref:Partial AB-hydrolase lipase domain-containing protein n=1 Tax=Heracleum sosnowskyi TaxID=360622 RepID=A0AAD8IMJ4_9APIA|nr:hypothetical protein POM88_016414 [Heracleum sosnowskyi]